MDEELILTKAQNAVLAHDWGTAARLYKELLKNDEANVVFLNALGNVYVKSGEDEKAIPYYEKIIENYPHNADAMNSLGAIYRRIKKYDESVKILLKAQSEQNSSSVNYNLGFTYKEIGNYEEAIEAFEFVITENPDDVLAYNHLGAIYFNQKNYEKSINSYKRGLQVDPNHPILNYNLARCYDEAENYPEAIRFYEKALKTRPGWVDAVRDFSSALIKCQKSRDAQSLVEKTIKMHPQNADLLCILGRIFLNQFDYDNASEAFGKAEEIKPDDVQILMGFSEALEKGDKINEALEKAVAAAEISPSNPDVKKRYIHTLLSAQKYEQAFEQVRELENSNANDLQALDLYGQYYICKGDETLANHYFKKIKEIDKNYNDYILNASDRFLQIGNLDKAEEYAKKYVEKKDSVPQGYNRLSEIYLAKGEWDKAKSILEKSSNLTQPNAIAKKHLEKIKIGIAKNPVVSNAPVFETENLNGEDNVPEIIENDETKNNLPDELSDEENAEKLEALVLSGDETANFSENIEENSCDEENPPENERNEIAEENNPDFDENENGEAEIPFEDDEKFNFAQMEDVPAAIETLTEENDDEDFWSDFEDKSDDAQDAEIVYQSDKKKSAENSDNDNYIEENEQIEEKNPIANVALQEKQRELAQNKALLDALDSADTALKMTMQTQQALKNLEEKQKELADDLNSKLEQIVKETAEKIAEEKMTVAEDDLNENADETDFCDVNEFSENNDGAGEEEFSEVGDFAESDEIAEPAEEEFCNVGEFSENDGEKIEVDDFKKLRNIFSYLPENGKDTFVANRIRMAIEYLIAKTSGKRGLLKTAKMWRKAAYDGENSGRIEENDVMIKEICDLLEYLKTLASNLENADVAKAICESADSVLNRINFDS